MTAISKPMSSLRKTFNIQHAYTPAFIISPLHGSGSPMSLSTQIFSVVPVSFWAVPKILFFETFIEEKFCGKNLNSSLGSRNERVIHLMKR